MSRVRVVLELSQGPGEEMAEALWEAIREAGIDGNVTVVSAEQLPDEEDE